MTTVYKYRFLCPTENIFIYSYGTTPPTTCPNDLAILNPATITIIETISENNVIIKNDISAVQGYYKCLTYDIGITGTTGMGSYTFLSPPYQLQLLTTNIIVRDDNIEDEVTINEFPDALIGAITANANIGDTTFTVSPGTFTYMGIGFSVKIGGYDVGLCTAKNTTLNTITTNTPLSTAVSAGGQVRITKVRVEKFKMCNKGTVSLGRTVSNVFVAPANTILRVDYNNTNGAVKNLHLYFEIFY